MKSSFLKQKALFIAGAMICSCGGPVLITSDADADTDECKTKEEICAEAESFQKQYHALPEEEKKDMLPVLNSYIEHCEQAQIQCNKSKRRKQDNPGE